MFILSVFLTLTGCHSTTKTAQAGNNKLWEGFINPPQESRPRIWWHWLNGNITANGVQKDLEWMHRIGLGGFHNFDTNQFTPQIVTNRLDYMSAPWKLLYKDMITKADSLGFEMGIAGSPGWSESGGPWVSLRESMKKIVWSETDIKGTTSYNGKLPQPPITSGAFQGMPTQAENGWAIPNYYEDIKVLAVRMPDDYISLELLHPRITTSGGGNFTVNQLSNGNYTDGILLPNKEDGSDTWIQYEFDKPQSFCSVLQSGGGRQVEGCYSTVTLQYSTDGSHYTDIAQLPGSGKVNVSALTFKPITARYFRLLFHDTPIPQEELETNPFAKIFGVKNFKTPGKLISEFNLLTIPMINHFIEKAGYSASGQLTSFTTPTVTQKQSIKQSNILDITKQVTTDGTLHWTPPTKGHWKIFRIGYSLTGKVNAPAVLEATGLEVDKLDADAVRRYFNTYLDLYKDATGGKMGNQGIHYMITDSWEAECQNWTPKMEAEFKHLRGYDMNAFFPTLMGYIVESTDKSERFLWDFRKTIGDLIVNNHYGTLTDILRQRGMEPQVWDPVTCSISYPSYRIQDGKTTVSLDLGPYDTRFIVFADKAKANEYICKNEPLTSFEDLSSSWSIKFDGLGCQKTIDCRQLMPWNESKDTSIRYYSGTATYTKHLELKRIPKTEYYLDLGKVNELAEVIVNGQSAGILWRAPFRCRVDKLLHKGDNTIQVKVTNLWVNRLIGDEQPGAKRLTWTSRKFYDSTDPLRQSGMLGPAILYKK